MGLKWVLSVASQELVLFVIEMGFKCYSQKLVLYVLRKIALCRSAPACDNFSKTNIEEILFGIIAYVAKQSESNTILIELKNTNCANYFDVRININYLAVVYVSCSRKSVFHPFFTATYLKLHQRQSQNVSINFEISL